MILPISIFSSAFDRRPIRREPTLEQLIRALTRKRVFPGITDKRNLPAWSPATFADGMPRAAEHVVAVSCLVLDHDGDRTVRDVADPWLDWLHIVHTTWSHTDASPRFRVVVPLAAPVEKAGWADVWDWAARRTNTDPHCRDASRLYFVPAVKAAVAPFLAWAGGADRPLLDPSTLGPPPRPPRPHLVAVPRSRLISAAQERLKYDIDARLRAADALGAAVRGEGEQQRATGIHCPKCGRPSMWFFVAPRRASRAWCNHRKSCGYSAWLDELFGALAA